MSDEGTGLTGTWAIGSTIVAALSSAVAFLYRTLVGHLEKRVVSLEAEVCTLRDSAEACQEAHAKTQVELASIKTELRLSNDRNKRQHPNEGAKQ